MMRWLQRWIDHERRHFQTPPEPDEAAVAREKERMQRDLAQMQRLNEFFLRRAVDSNTISPERAAAIRLTQSTENEDDVVRILQAKARMRAREA